MSTLRYIANKLNVSIYDMLNELEANGIYIQNPDNELSLKQRQSIKAAINNINDAEKKLNDYVLNYKIFIDTCSLMETKIDLFYKHIYPILMRQNVKIIVPNLVIEELYKHLKSPDLDKKMKANNGLVILKRLRQDGLLDIRGDNSDLYADNVFLSVFTKYRLQYNLLLITQDRDLAKDILVLNNANSVKGTKKILVKRINKYGYLSNIENLDIEENSKKMNNNKEKNTGKFNLGTNVKKIDNSILNITSIPDENDFVKSSLYGDIKLDKKIASGGEGSVYTTDTEYVAKIYKKDKLTLDKLEKLKLMVSKKIECEGICWPKDIVYNSNGEFVGYLMQKAKGKEMQKLLLSKPVLLKNMPNWKKRDLVELSVTILEKIQYLHKCNVILGDINPMNILIESSKEVYLVDTDSYQIEDFPCPVGTIIFTAQEILRADEQYKKIHKKDRKYSDYLRTFENEYFAIAVLLFMIMLPGKNPYSLQGGESIKQNLLNMDFAYPLGEQSNKKAPEGPWKFIWSHMPYLVKKSFYHTFVKDGDYSKPENRLDVSAWLKLMKRYLFLLDSGKLADQDKMSEEMFPIRRKKVSTINYSNCKICGIEEPEDRLKEGICHDCLNGAEVYSCKQCGKEIKFTNYDKYIKKKNKPDVCHDCYEKNNQVYMKIRCSDCGNVFEITNREYKFYVQQGFEIPKRCKACRSNSSSTNRRRVNPSIKQKPKPASGCFITTAVCEYFNKPDDCYELTMLRAFRDKWLKNQPDGEALIKEYYAIAPDLVDKIDTSSNRDEIYQILWSQYIKVCLELIENNSYQECKSKYVAMINYLKSIFK